MIKKIVAFTTLSPLLLIIMDYPASIERILPTAASIVGYIGLIMILWSIILGSKPLARLISSDYVELNKTHRFLGKYGILFALIHPFLEMFSYLENISWVITPSLATEFDFHISLGRLTLLVFLIIWLSSITLRSKLKYRPWLRIHYLTYPLGLLALFHIRDIGFYYTQSRFISVFFSLILIAYCFYLAYLFLLWAGFFKNHYTVKSISKIGQGSEINILDLETTGKPLTSQPGQYVYIQMHRFGEVKPFSILENDGNKLRLGIKNDGEFTSRVGELKPGHEIGVFGPLGKFTQQGHNDSDKIIISGGIGITPLVELSEKYFTPNSFFFVCNRYRSDVVDLDRLKKSTNNRLYEVYSRETTIENERQRNCRLDKNVLQEILGSNNINNYKIFICGSSPFMNEAIKNLTSLGVKRENIYTEEFSF